MHKQGQSSTTNVIAVVTDEEQVVCSQTAWGQISLNIINCVTLGRSF